MNKKPKSVQAAIKADLREIHGAPTRAVAEVAMGVFVEKHGVKYERAATRLTEDRDALLAFYDMPAEHWDHLRTSNPIESVFATVRHRSVRSKGALWPTTAKLLVFKRVMAAAKTWRRLKAKTNCPKSSPASSSVTGPRSPRAQITAPPDGLPSPKIPHNSPRTASAQPHAYL